MIMSKIMALAVESRVEVVVVVQEVRREVDHVGLVGGVGEEGVEDWQSAPTIVSRREQMIHVPRETTLQHQRRLIRMYRETRQTSTRRCQC